MHVCAFYNKIWVIDTWVYSSFEENRYGQWWTQKFIFEGVKWKLIFSLYI